MGQKVHPKGYRLGITTEHKSRWYADSTKVGQRYQDYVKSDIQIRRLITKFWDRAGISNIVIERTTDTIRIDVFAARPGLAIGRQGGEVDKLRNEIANQTNKQIRLNVLEAANKDADAQILSQAVAEQLVARVTFRKAMKKCIQQALKNGAQGIKIMCSGRLGGAEMARQEFYREGSVPLHTLRAYVDYGFYEAHTTFGRIGVKVWVYKGMTSESEWNARSHSNGGRNNRDRNNRKSRPSETVSNVEQSATTEAAKTNTEKSEA